MNNRTIQTINVFVDEEGKYGSPLGIVLDEKKELSGFKRQEIAAKLNYSETVFINNPHTGDISVFSPIRECPFSMYATVGVGWFITRKLGIRLAALTSKHETIKLSFEGEQIWVMSPVSILPKWNYVQYSSVDEIESLRKDDFTHAPHTMVWAWEDVEKGIVRARTFAADWGIPEDEANGSGTIRLASILRKSITVTHGRGSLIFANPLSDQDVRLGGFCST